MRSHQHAILVQVNYSFDMAVDDYVSAAAPYADAVAAVPGLRWKIWLVDPERSEGAGIYLFDDVIQAKAYIEGPLLKPFLEHPSIGNVSVKLLHVLDEPTAITRGPVHELI